MRMNKWKIGRWDFDLSKVIGFIFGVLFTTCVTVLAETCQTTLSSSNVTYEDTTVQAETNELITQAGNIDSRVTTLENKDYAKRLTGEKVTTWTDNEGGNLRLFSKSGTYFSEMDMYNDTTWRIYHGTNNPNAVTGSITHSYNKTANLDYLDGVTSNIQTQLNAKMPLSTNAIEMAGTSTNGGYIDFHYNNSTADYTSRLIDRNGLLSIEASKGVKINGNVVPVTINARSSTANLNTIYENQIDESVLFISGQGEINQPVSGSGAIHLVISYKVNSLWGYQYAFQGGNLYARSMNNGTWTTWGQRL
jgi:hypothetical protein